MWPRLARSLIWASTDGLVHVSQLSHTFTSDAREVVKTGDIVKVQVVEVDLLRKRIGLTMKLGAAPSRAVTPSGNHFEHAPRSARQSAAPQGSAMASAFAKLQGLKK